MKKSRIDFILLVILLCGLTLRLYNLGKYSLWYDEAISILLGPKYIWQGLNNLSIVGPGLSLFPFLVYFWKYLGNSEFILRLLPAAFGVFSIIIIYILAKLLFTKKVAQISAFILSISPFHIYYSQELRYNTLVVFLVLLSVYFYLKSLKEDRKLSWIAFVTFVILSIYSHFIAIFILLSLNIHYFSFFNKYKKLVSTWLITQLAVLFFLIPWFMIISKQLSLPNPFVTSPFIQKKHPW